MKTIAKSTLVLTISTLLAKILSLIQIITMAHVFGISSTTDAYLVASTVPDIIFALLGWSLVITAVPIYSKYTAQGKKEEAWQVFNIFLTILVLLLVLLILICLVFSRHILLLIAPSLPQETAFLANQLILIMLPTLLFFSLANVFAGLLNANNVFGPPALMPVVINISIIISIFMAFKFGIHGVAVGTLLGHGVAAVMQVPYLRRHGFMFCPSLNLNHPDVKKIFSLLLPVMIGTGISQIYQLIERILASGLEVGSITALNYAYKIILIPNGIFSMAVGTAIFTAMSISAAQNDQIKLAYLIQKGIRIVLLISLPAGVGLIVLREPVVRFLFAQGAFSERDVYMTTFAVLFFSLGLIGHSLNAVLCRGFYALQNTIIPVKVGLISLAINLIFSLLLIGPLKHGGLALANSIASIFNIIMLFWLFIRRVPNLNLKPLLYFFCVIFISSMTMGMLIYGFDSFLSSFLLNGNVLILRVGLDMLAGVLIIALLYQILQVDEYLSIKDFASRFFKSILLGLRQRT